MSTRDAVSVDIGTMAPLKWLVVRANGWNSSPEEQEMRFSGRVVETAGVPFNAGVSLQMENHASSVRRRRDGFNVVLVTSAVDDDGDPRL